MQQSQPWRVLVVDDDPDLRRLLAAMISALGLEVETAVDGPSALAAAAARVPDAVMLDISMPGMDGLQVCRRLRAAKETAGVPVLLVTADAGLATRLAGFDAGADDYVTKPFEPRELSARLRAHLELTAARIRLAQLEGALATIRAVSHEFNNPLQAVVGALDLIENAPPALDASEALGIASENVERLRELARRIVRITEPCFVETPIGKMLDVRSSR